MTMKPTLILKSLADLPANALGCAASAPRRAISASRQMLAVPARATRREIRAARRRSAEFARNIYAWASVPLQNIKPWPRGGLNE
jgi:hypothetical protein